MSRFCVRCVLMFVACLIVKVASAEQHVAIRADFPGGNIVVVKNDGNAVQLAPDLRGGQSWFYWNFEAIAAEPGRVTFAFADAPMIGVRGPAYSIDEGTEWQWLGAEHCTYSPIGSSKDRRESFTYEFKPQQLKVRFAVAIPYLPANLQTFLEARKDNANLKQLMLTKSRIGTPIELLVVGTPAAEREALLVTARHHACESMASYVLEGFIDEAISESPFGKSFRERYALFSVPMVDRDGVATGDQGKNRSPHDHNRDYGPMSMYPEVAAIQELGETHDIKYALDFHCPALRGDIHEAFHFLGLGVPLVKENLDEFIHWIRVERPQLVMTPLNFLTDPQKPNATNSKIYSHHFALRKNAVIAATLEIPYAQQSPALNVEMAREYGRGLLRAWTRTTFLTRDSETTRGQAGYTEFTALRAAFMKIYRSMPAQAEASLQMHLTADAPPLYRVEANLLMSQLRHYQRRYAEGREFCETALKDPQASALQRIEASITRLQIMADDPATETALMYELLQQFLKLPFPANDQTSKALNAVAKFHVSRKHYAEAVVIKQRQLKVAALHETGAVLLQQATFYDQLQKPAEATNCRQEAIAILRERLGSKPKRNIFDAMMTIDLFDALCGVPTSTLAEKQAAAKFVLEHEIVAPTHKERVRKQLAELEARAK